MSYGRPLNSGGVGKDCAKEINGMVEGLLELENGLSEWEVDFVESIKKNFVLYGRLTDPQMCKLMEVYDKKVLEKD